MDLKRACTPCDGPCAPKHMWPEVVGMKGKDAKAIIEKDHPGVQVVYIWCKGIKIMDCCCNRVWLEVDTHFGRDYENAIVCRVPKLG